MELMTINEVAEFLKVSRQTVINRINDGKLKALKNGRIVRIEKAEVERFMREGANNG